MPFEISPEYLVLPYKWRRLFISIFFLQYIVVNALPSWQHDVGMKPKKVRPTTLTVVTRCPGLNTYEMHAPYDKHHKVSLLVKVQQDRHSCVKIIHV